MSKREEILKTIDLNSIEDPQSRKNAEILRSGLLAAKTPLDVEWEWIAYCSAEANRLSIKATIIKSNSK